MDGTVKWTLKLSNEEVITIRNALCRSDTVNAKKLLTRLGEIERNEQSVPKPNDTD